MATDRVLREEVVRALATARDGEPEVGFDPEALAAVVRRCDSARNGDRVLAVVDEVMQDRIAALDQAGALAAVALRQRVEAATQRRIVPVENLQGDVGAGSS